MSLLQRVPEVVFQELDGEVLVLRPGQQDVLHLNRTASDVWELLAVDSTADELAQTLATAYQQDPVKVRADLEPLLTVLLEHGVVRETGA